MYRHTINDSPRTMKTKRSNGRLGLLFTMICACLAINPSPTVAQITRANEALAGREALESGNYDRAIDLFRSAVRQYPQDYDTWTQLAAAYFHSGLPRRALRYLKMAEKKTSIRSYNLLYQGLAYQALDAKEKSRLFLKNAAQFPDSSGGRAMIEIGLMDYKAKDNERATYWFNLYLQRHPRGPFRQDATKMLSAIRSGKTLASVATSNSPDTESALFKYNKLSLGTMPHFWFSQVGGSYRSKTVFEKDDRRAFSQSTPESQSLLASGGIGLGPIRNSEGSIWAGYNYFQDWNTLNERVKTYFDEPGDIAYQPFRADLMERRHQFYADARRELPFNLQIGAFFRLEFARIGSSMFSGPEIQSFDSEVQAIADTTWFVPWIGYDWNPNMRTSMYFYLRKEINEEVPDFSNKSYSFEVGADSTLPLSFGISHDMVLPKFKTEASAELYSYEFIANDPWFDYSRQGFNGSLDHQVIPDLYVTLGGGYFRDTYIEEILKNGACNLTKISDGASLTQNEGEATAPVRCYRDETGFMVRAGVFLNLSQFQRIGGELSYVSTSNPNQKEFETSTLSLLGTATIAFPSVKRVQRFVSRYADTALTKKDQ